MEVDEVDEVVDEIQTQVINKIQKIRANSSNPNYSFPVVTDDCSGRWPSSRIVRVSRASGGKDRHSKVVTSKGLRDRRIRLSVSTAIEFYDLQDRLGFDQPSKAVEWLINAASSSISELPSLDPPLNHQFSGRNNQMGDDNNNNNNSNSNSNSNNNNAVVSKVSACSSTSETSKGSGHSRTENRIRARERARDRRKSPFTDLLTSGVVSPMDYFQPSQFNQPEHNGFSFSNFAPAGTTVASTGTGGTGLGSGLNRGTLQSNLVSCLPHQQYHLQSFQPLSMVDGSTSTNFHFLTSPFTDSFPTSGYDPSQRLQLYGGGDAEGRDSNDHYKGKSKT